MVSAPARAPSRWIPLLAILGACAGADTDDGYVLAETEHGATLRRVAPLADVPRWSLDTVRLIASDDWADPSGTSIAGGRVAVVDPRAGRVHVYEIASGDPVASIGRPGEGPGAWRQLVGAVLREDGVAVSTGETPGLTLYDFSGAESGRIEAPLPSLRIGAGANGTILGRSPADPRQILLVAPGRGSVRTFTLPEPAYPTDTFGDCWRMAPVATGLVRLTCTAGRLEFIDSLGLAEGRVEWAVDPAPSTEAELDGYLERFWEARGGGLPRSPLVERQLAVVREGARIRPVYADLVADPLGASLLVVEQPFGDFGDVPAALHVLGPDGRHRGIVETDLFVRGMAVFGDTLSFLARSPATGLVELVIATFDEGAAGWEDR